MLVVSDTTAITNLLKINLLDLVRKVYREILIPQAVYEELSKLPNQKKIIDNAKWIKIKSIKDESLAQKLRSRLDPGESEAIVLALELKSDILIMDENAGRRIAKEYGLTIIGLLGILIGAKKRGYIKSVKPHMIDLIENHGFRISESVYNQVLKLAKEK
jgi:predicted nucleic acid-binding protein